MEGKVVGAVLFFRFITKPPIDQRVNSNDTTLVFSYTSLELGQDKYSCEMK